MRDAGGIESGEAFGPVVLRRKLVRLADRYRDREITREEFEAEVDQILEETRDLAG